MVTVDEVLDVLRPFEEMDRTYNNNLDEIACTRGCSSDMTIITSNDFRKAKELCDRLKEECIVDDRPQDEFTKSYSKSMNL